MKVLYNLLIVVFFFSGNTVDAQKNNYVDGFIITLQNDTIACWVQKRNWKKQPEEIRVKSGEKDTAATPQPIRGFIVPSLQLRYTSKAISPARYVDNIQNAVNSKLPDPDTLKVAFLKVLHSGMLNLYLYLDRLNRKHFFVENKDNFLEIYSHYYSGFGGDRNSQPVANLNKQYEFTLKVLMTPCRNVFSIIESIQLKEDHLTGLFKVYDKCMTPKKEN